MIALAGQLAREVEAHGERTYPHECGGMLIGRFGTGGARTVVEILPLDNASLEDQSHRVLILPKDVLRAERYAGDRQLDVVGFYHSHPDDRAVPSAYDLDNALPVWSYVIVSVMAGKAVDVRSWVMEDDRSRFNEERIEDVHGNG
jgi:proteasome lid subunit RPN8/RPN11